MNGLQRLQRRVTAVAEAALDEQGFVSPIDVLVGLGWLASANVDRWRQGRMDHLEQVVGVGPDRIVDAFEALVGWAVDNRLEPREVDYLARTPRRRWLRFSAAGDEATELLYRTHLFSPSMPTTEKEHVVERSGKPPDLVVISPLNTSWTCTECGDTGDLLIIDEPGPMCMRCADLDHLVLLPAGDAALTRRAKNASALWAVVVRFSRARKRYERQGLLVEETALETAEEQCLADEDVRRRRRERAAETRERHDAELQAAFAAAIRELFPGCSVDRADAIATRAATRRSGRVGRTAAGQALESGAVTAAVVAPVRHADTPYDELLMTGTDRDDARRRVGPAVDEILDSWRSTPD